MLHLVARRAECNQIVQCIVAEAASFHQMMHLQLFRRTAVLASPSIPFEHSSMKQLVFDGA
jgi:hypothetical protein